MQVANAVLRLPAVKEAVGYGRTKIYEMIGEGVFPKPVPLDPNRVAGGKSAVGWVKTEVEEWLAQRVAARG